MKKILFFAVMFVVALCSTALVSCGDDEEDEPTVDNVFKSTIKITNDVLEIYKDVSVVYIFADGTEISGDVTGTTITFERPMKERGDVVVKFIGTLREDVVQDDKNYELLISYRGEYDHMLLTSTFGGSKLGNIIKAKYKDLSSVAGFNKHTYAFTSSIGE